MRKGVRVQLFIVFFSKMFFDKLLYLYNNSIDNNDKKHFFSELESINIFPNSQWKLIYEDGTKFEWSTLFDLCKKTSSMNIRSENEMNTFVLY